MKLKGLMEAREIHFFKNGKKYEGNYGKKEWFCHYHGKGEHSTKFCKVVNALEAKGWRRNTFENQVRNMDEEKLNKNNQEYFDLRKIFFL
jgi:hypothetical protein